MKYRSEIVINRPRSEVIALFDNAENLKHWQPELLSFEHISGEPGEVGAKSKLCYRMGKRDVEMVETITVKDLPDTFSGTYECDGTINYMENRFYEEAPGTTRWVADSEFHCSGLLMRIMAFLMPGMFKKQTMRYLENFKAFAESGASAREGISPA